MKPLIALTLLSFPLLAQQNEIPKTRIGVHYSAPAGNSIFTFQSLTGTGSYSNKGTISFGFSAERALNRNLAFESGITYSKHKTSILPAFTGIPREARNETVEIITIPVLLKLYWAKYFFVNGGVLADFDISSKSTTVHSQNGIGALLGIGAKYDFKSNLSVQVNPNLKLHSLIPFSSEKYHHRILESGVKIGLYYNL